MSEKVKVWIARDGEESVTKTGILVMYMEKPTKKFNTGGAPYFSVNSTVFSVLDSTILADIKNGECREAENILGKKL